MNKIDRKELSRRGYARRTYARRTGLLEAPLGSLYVNVSEGKAYVYAEYIHKSGQVEYKWVPIVVQQS